VKPNGQLRVVVDGDAFPESHATHRVPDEVRRRIIDLVPATGHRRGAARSFPAKLKKKNVFLVNLFTDLYFFK
jgi:hypothetical protein